MGPASTITRTLQRAIDLVPKPESHTQDRGRSPRNLRGYFSRSRTNSPRDSAGYPSDSRGRIRTKSSPGPAREGGRLVHLLADSPPGSERNIIRVPSTRYHSGRRRFVQESLNNKVDTSHPPPVPEMPPRWQEVINAIRGEKKGGPRTEHEEEVRRNFEKLKKKGWDDLSPEEQAKETNHLENKNRLKAWDLERDITRQTKKVEKADEEAEEKVKAAASAKRRLERLKKRQNGQVTPPSGSPTAVKRGTKPKAPRKTSNSDEELSPRSGNNEPEGLNGENSSQQAIESRQARNAPSTSRQVQEYSNSLDRPKSQRSSTCPTSVVSSQRGSSALQRPSQSARSCTAPIPAVLSEVESAESRRSSQDTESSTAPSRPTQSEAQVNMQQSSRIVEHSNAQTSAREVSGARVTSQIVAGRSTTKQILQPSQLRQVSNADVVESSSSRRPASRQSEVAREEESKLQKESQAAIVSSRSSQREQTARSTKSDEKRAQKHKSQFEKKGTAVQSSQLTRTTLAPLTEENLKSASDHFVVESAAAFEVQTELNRGLGDNMRTIIEGLAPMTPSEITEEDDKRRDAAREALEEAEREEQERLLVTELHRGPGDNMRTHLEGMRPMTSEDVRVEQQKWNSRKRQQLEAEEEAEHAKLVQTEFNRQIGNMMRYGPTFQSTRNCQNLLYATEADKRDRTNLEGMVPMTSEEVKQVARERLEEEERRLQDELLKTRFNRDAGDNMRYVKARDSCDARKIFSQTITYNRGS
ncbi:hypothetical protein IFR04_009413 [Cadophora malorum]|uniref:Uncharacterized protein n=1 Tax=Cadophora malorum TaxID=108018 RepID=A0A8H7W521_9HELO|nr:hypothetical protein IFR04_009413 [Cadophora malorum]